MFSAKTSQGYNGRTEKRWNQLDESLAGLNGFVPIRNVAFAMLFTTLIVGSIAAILGWGYGIHHPTAATYIFTARNLDKACTQIARAAQAHPDQDVRVDLKFK